MPEFHLRIWAEQTLFDCNDYTVTAETLRDAVAALREVQNSADGYGTKRAHPDIRGLEDWNEDRVLVLDPEEVVDGKNGVTLIDATGVRVRDLIGLPTGCVQLGEPLLEPGEIPE
jgi:hypothetical protein